MLEPRDMTHFFRKSGILFCFEKRLFFGGWGWGVGGGGGLMYKRHHNYSSYPNPNHYVIPNLSLNPNHKPTQDYPNPTLTQP